MLATMGAVAGAAPVASASSVDDGWQAFKAKYVAADGRVIDNVNGGVSHSEGQGWGLLFATAAGDRDSFDRILGWTERTLRRPTDRLHAWRFVPSDQPPVQDLNNATDGDIFIAAALARAGRRWGNPNHLQAAAAIARDILAKLVRPVGPRVVLLPGVNGFESTDATIVNPSYYAFPFFSDIAGLVPSPQWDIVQRDGRRIVDQARFGKWELPADWLRVPRDGSAISPAPGWPPRFGFDAIRIPLWYTWQNLPVGHLRQALGRYWSSFPGDSFPAWVDVATNETAPYPAPPGMVAVARLTRAAMGDRAPPELPKVADAGSYYDAALILLSSLAWRALHPG